MERLGRTRYRVLVPLPEARGVVRGTIALLLLVDRWRRSGPSPQPSRHLWIAFWRETQLLFGLATAPAAWTSITISA